jgi:hypothetical protein
MQSANVDASTNAATCESALVHEAQLIRSYARYVVFIGVRLLGNRANVIDLVQLALRHALGRCAHARSPSAESSRAWGDEIGEK